MSKNRRIYKQNPNQSNLKMFKPNKLNYFHQIRLNKQNC